MPQTYHTPWVIWRNSFFSLSSANFFRRLLPSRASIFSSLSVLSCANARAQRQAGVHCTSFKSSSAETPYSFASPSSATRAVFSPKAMVFPPFPSIPRTAAGWYGTRTAPPPHLQLTPRHRLPPPLIAQKTVAPPHMAGRRAGNGRAANQRPESPCACAADGGPGRPAAKGRPPAGP